MRRHTSFLLSSLRGKSFSSLTPIPVVILKVLTKSFSSLTPIPVVILNVLTNRSEGLSEDVTDSEHQEQHFTEGEDMTLFQLFPS